MSSAGTPDRPPMTEDDVASIFTKESWDERYGAADRVWSGRPNARLVEHVAEIERRGPAGTALDVGCGEGADVVWLAARGWSVTGVDVSPVALARARRHADEAGVGAAVVLHEHDVLGGDPPPGLAGGHDLVTVHFLHPPPAELLAVYARLAAAVAPGGRLLVVGHHPSDLDTGVRRPDFPGLLFEPSRITDVLAGRPGGSDWTVEVAAVAARTQETSDGPVTVHDTVVRARREGGTTERAAEGQAPR